MDEKKGETIELWGRSPHNGIWFPWYKMNLPQMGADAPNQFELRYSGQIPQFITEPSDPVCSTPQVAKPVNGC